MWFVIAVLIQEVVPLTLLVSSFQRAELLLVLSQLNNCHVIALVPESEQGVFFQAGRRECSASRIVEAKDV